MLTFFLSCDATTLYNWEAPYSIPDPTILRDELPELIRTVQSFILDHPFI